MANMLAGGKTPRVDHGQLQTMGYRIAAYPFDILVGAIAGMRKALSEIKDGAPVPPAEETAMLWQLAGFNAYRAEEQLYS